MAQTSGVILAGGASRRMGRDKALLDFGGRPLIAVVAQRLRAVTDEVIVVADDAVPYEAHADRAVPDVYPGVGTLGGIHAGLRAAAHDPVIVVGCDMPFLRPELLAWFLSASTGSNGSGGADLVVLQHDLGVEPLHAVYRKSCLPAIEATIGSGERCAYAFYDQIRVRYVSRQEIAALDPDLRSFRNLNSPNQWSDAMMEAGLALGSAPSVPRRASGLPAAAGARRRLPSPR